MLVWRPVSGPDNPDKPVAECQTVLAFAAAGDDGGGGGADYRNS